MIKKTKKSHASHVKFQLFNKQTIEDSPYRERLLPLILSENSVKKLKQIADIWRIGFILTPMYLEAVDIAAKYADFIKIRYVDHNNHELIDRALDTGKTLLISVDCRPIGAMAYNPRIRWLYNIPHYPPTPEDFNLEAAGACDGFSSHYPHFLFDLAYVIDRIPDEAYLEKHVMNLGRDAWRRCCATNLRVPIDDKVSVTFKELKNFILQLRLIERIKRLRL